MRILFVCLGNICRSPMAEGLMRKKIAEEGLDVEVDSCGTGNYHEGEAPDLRAQEEMERHGIDISDLIARPFEDMDLERFDRIYTMDGENQSRILDRARDVAETRKVDLILNILPEEHNSPVPDPYFGGGDGFRTVYDLLDRATDGILKEIQNERRER